MVVPHEAPMAHERGDGRPDGPPVALILKLGLILVLRWVWLR